MDKTTIEKVNELKMVAFPGIVFFKGTRETGEKNCLFVIEATLTKIKLEQPTAEYMNVEAVVDAVYDLFKENPEWDDYNRGVYFTFQEFMRGSRNYGFNSRVDEWYESHYDEYGHRKK